MKKEIKVLLNKAVDSLILAVEHFNRPWDCGRKESVLILLDHAFELLLKASILNKGQRIRERRKNETYGYDKCLRVALANRIVNEEQALTLQSINNLRDAAQHYIVELTEQHFYFQAQAGLTLFKELLSSNFGQSLANDLPKRVLPLSTTPITDINTFFDTEIREVRKLLAPGRRKKLEASAILRGLAIFDGAIQGENIQPSTSRLNRIIRQVKEGHSLSQIFPGIAAITITANGSGPHISLSITLSIRLSYF